MAIIGHCDPHDDGFTGQLHTLMLEVRLALVPNPKLRANAPDFQVLAVGGYEIDAAWKKVSQVERPYLSVTLDDPSFASPVYASLVEGDDGGHALIWSRQKAESADSRGRTGYAIALSMSCALRMPSVPGSRFGRFAVSPSVPRRSRLQGQRAPCAPAAEAGNATWRLALRCAVPGRFRAIPPKQPELITMSQLSLLSETCLLVRDDQGRYVPATADQILIGMYGQTFLLSLTAHGLRGISQTMLGLYAGSIREVLGIDPASKLLFGISFVYPDPAAAAANRYRLGKAFIENGVTFHT